MAMNIGKVITGGLVAGVVINAVGYGVNEAWLGQRWMNEMVRLNLSTSDATKQSSMIGWISTSFLLGLLVIWLYAAIRPRFGQGPRTAAKASIAVWLITLQMGLSMWFTGLYGMHLVMFSVFGSLVGLLLGGQIGAMLYSE